MAHVYLSLGSNVERELHIRQALDALNAEFNNLVMSTVYESESVGFDGDAFYNLVVSIDTDLSVGDLSLLLRQMETDHGRDRSLEKFSSRTLDIDILTYAEYVGVVDGVDLPRKEILTNAFVLMPLAEIAADETHPEAKQSYQQLWDAYDQASQKLWPIEFNWPS